ncbi:MAG: hypothetical protein WCK06_04905 [Actinomycetota bacterium]
MASEINEESRSGGLARIRHAWDVLITEQRLAGGAAVALFLTMLLPWYSKSYFYNGKISDDSMSAFGAFSFVEAAVLLVASFVLVLLFARGERRAFHLPGGDGTVIMGAGAWAACLIAYRLFDLPEVKGTAKVGASVGLQWGIFVALVAAIVLAYAGWLIRAAHRPEPPLPAARPDPWIGSDFAEDRTGATVRVPRDAMVTERIAHDLEIDDPPTPTPPPSSNPGGRAPRPRRAGQQPPTGQSQIPGLDD